MAEKKFPWGCVLGGCAITTVLLVTLIGGVSYYGIRRAKQFGEDLKDPDKRAAKVMDILGAERLPEGLYPVIGMSIPFIVDFAFLGDQPPEADGEPGEPEDSGFFYFSLLTMGEDRQEMRELFEGKRRSTRLLRQNDIDFDTDELLGRGQLQDEDRSIGWVAYRGEMEHHDALLTMLLVECSESDRRLRLGIWFQPDPEPMAPLEDLELVGTCADEEAIEDFTAYFDFCRS
jgi:hypothetical protein